ncbi:MAG: VTT domain-containing protein [Burkholderiales bacterium]
MTQSEPLPPVATRLEGAPSRAKLLKLCAGALAVLALVAVYWVQRDTGALGTIVDGERLRAQIENLGAWGPLAVISLMTLAILVSPIPSAPIAMAAGAAYGHGWGTLYVLIGAEAGALAAFGLARILGGAALSRWFGNRMSVGLSGSQNVLMGIVFVSRLLPFISFDLISYAAGLTALSLWRFALATLAGIVPASFVLTHLGFEMASGETDRFMYTAFALGLLTAIPIAVTLVRDRMRRRRV